MSLETIEIETANSPTASMIVLHGLGADGNDFVPVAQELDLSSVGPVRFIFPHAPTMPVTINGGYVMRAWYDILGTDLVRKEDEAHGADLAQVEFLRDGDEIIAVCAEPVQHDHAGGRAVGCLDLDGLQRHAGS